MRAYDFYSRVEEYQKTNEWAIFIHEFSDTPQRVNKIVRSIFHGVICLFYKYWDFWKEKLPVKFISLGAHV